MVINSTMHPHINKHACVFFHLSHTGGYAHSLYVDSFLTNRLLSLKVFEDRGRIMGFFQVKPHVTWSNFQVQVPK